MAGAGWSTVFGTAWGRLSLAGRLRQELLEILKKIRRGIEEGSDLSINVLNGLLFSLVGLKYL